jgi:methyl-accepting chemotaxis protein
MPNLNAMESILMKIRGCSRGVLSRMRRNGSSRKDWLRVLPALESEMEILGTSTEGQFLSIGEKLQDFYGRAKEISSISVSVARLMSGEEIEGSIAGFREVIVRIEKLESESKRNLQTLQRLIELLSELQSHLSGFHKIVRSLRVLCVSIKVESARLGDKDIGFSVLADEVGKLALEVEEKYSHVLEQTASLSHLIGQTLLKVSDLETRQQVQAALIVEKTMSSLESLTERHSSSSADTTRIAARYDTISGRIGEIVASMQSHDITRQRIEHAREALSGIVGEEGPANAQLALAGAVCELQIAQLCNARDALVAAVENIVSNLRGVSGLVAEMSRETERMAGSQDESGRSFLSELEADIASVASAFGSYAEQDRELSVIIGSVGSTLGNMSAFAGEIEGVGNKIKLIALNAIVKACHIGDEGRTLSVLAESIHRLSTETCGRTETVGGALRSMTSEAEALSGGIDACEEGGGNEAAGVHEVLGTLFSTLEKTSHRIVTLLARMNNEGSALSEDTLKTAEEIEVHHRVDAVISNVVTKLDEIVSASQALNPDDDPHHMVDQIQAMEASYTMQQERAVHLSIMTPATVLETSDPELFSASGAGRTAEADDHTCEPSSESEEDLGDNVELF